jgi:hypothetical protein
MTVIVTIAAIVPLFIIIIYYDKTLYKTSR